MKLKFHIQQLGLFMMVTVVVRDSIQLYFAGGQGPLLNHKCYYQSKNLANQILSSEHPKYSVRTGVDLVLPRDLPRAFRNPTAVEISQSSAPFSLCNCFLSCLSFKLVYCFHMNPYYVSSTQLHILLICISNLDLHRICILLS